MTEARASVGRAQLPAGLPTDPAQLQAYMKAQQGLGSALGRMFMVTERYPELKANQNFLSLQDQLEGTENRIAVARRDGCRPCHQQRLAEYSDQSIDLHRRIVSISYLLRGSPSTGWAGLGRRMNRIGRALSTS